MFRLGAVGVMDLIAEDLMLLMLDEQKGRPTVGGPQFTHSLAGALLVELSLQGLVESDSPPEKQARGKGKIHAIGAVPEDPILAIAWNAFSDKPRGASAVIQAIDSKVKDPLLERLVAKGWVREERTKVLGLFPSTTFPEADSRHESELRSRIAGVLAGTDPDPRSAVLISLLSAADGLKALFPDADRKELKARAAEISDGEWAGAAVRQAVQAVNAAVMTAVMVPVFISTSS